MIPNSIWKEAVAMMFKKLFLPVGMALFVALSLVTPEPGLWLKQHIGTNAMIMAIFLVSGMQADFRELKLSGRLCGGLLLGAFFALVLFSLGGFAALRPTALDRMLLSGLLVMMAAPPTLSSGIVMTVQAKGNMMLAVAITVLFNLAAIVTLPAVLGYLLNEALEDGVDGWKMLRQLVVLVLIPLFIGHLAKKILLKNRWHKSIDYVPPAATIGLIGCFFAAARDTILALPGRMVLVVLLLCGALHLISMLALWGVGALVRMDGGECRAMIFCGASKSATMALAMVAIAGLGETSAVVPCLLFYALQMLTDSFLSDCAARLAPEPGAAPSPA